MDYFLSSWCLTIKKGAANPDSKNEIIIASNLRLFSTENPIFFPGPSSYLLRRTRGGEPPDALSQQSAVGSSTKGPETEGGRTGGRKRRCFLTTLFSQPPLQCSCLENPMDREARQAAVHSVARSWTRLK